MGGAAGPAPRADLPAAVGPAQHLRLRLLGPPDRRRPHGRRRPPAGPARSGSASTSCAAAPRRRPARAAQHLGGPLPGCWTAPCTATSAARSGSCARRALRRAERWIVQRQEADGSWGGIQPPWVYSLIALHLQGYALDHPVMRAGLDGLDGFTIDDEAGRRLEACQSPVWDTALAVIALADAGVPRGRPGAPLGGRAGCWPRRSPSAGDWAVRRPDLPAGGLGLRVRQRQLPRHRRHRRGRARPCERTTEPTRRRRRPGASPGSRGCSAATAAGPPSTSTTRGRCAASCRSATSARSSTRRAPTSPPTWSRCSPRLGRSARGGRARRALAPAGPGGRTAPGSGAGAPTTSTAPARSSRRSSPPGVDAGDPAVRRAVAWLERHQNADGGWGEDLRSYRDDAYRGPRPLDRLPDGLGPARPARRGRAIRRPPSAAWRSSSTTQAEDGTWDEPWFTGTGFPGDFYINYHLYRLVFPVMALGRYVNGGANG